MKKREMLIVLWRLLTTVRNFPVYFRMRFGNSQGKGAIYRLWNDITIESRNRATDGMALNDVWLERTYEPNLFGIPFDWKSAATIVDIGANIGTFSLYALHRAPQARILAVEPEPGNAAMLRRNLTANGLQDRVTVVEAGIGPEATTATLHVAHKNSGGHSLFHYTEASHPVSVQILPLRTILEQHAIRSCDFLKLDCEGGEYDGLYGLGEEMLRSIRFIAVEYHHFSKDPLHTPDALRAFLEKHGFAVSQPKKSIFFAVNQSRQR